MPKAACEMCACFPALNSVYPEGASGLNNYVSALIQIEKNI